MFVAAGKITKVLVVGLPAHFDRAFICNVVSLEFKKMWVFPIANFVAKSKWPLKVDVVNREHENTRQSRLLLKINNSMNNLTKTSCNIF